MTAAVPALRTTWRRSTEHFAEQVKRFIRLTALAAAPSLVDLIKGGRFDRVTLLAFLVPVFEVAWRQMFPALGAAAADAAPGVRIVPAQVGLAPVPAAPVDAMPDPMGEDPGLLPIDSEAGHADAVALLYLAAGLIVFLVILRVFHLI